MKRIAKIIIALVLVTSGVNTFAKDKPLSIAKQGIFSSGGSITKAVPGEYDEKTNWQDTTRKGNTAHIDHANTFYQIPAKEKGLPVVFLHGYGQSRVCWQTTPDGRDGWSDIFLRKGHSVFLVDQPRRGSAGSTSSMSTDGFLDVWENSKEYKPGDQAWYTHFRIGRVAPERYEGSQFPAGEEAQNQFFRQMTPNTGNYDSVLFGKSLGAVLSDVKKMTGKKSVFITHSQGVRVGWQVETENIACIIAVEGAAPEINSDTYKNLLEAKIPVLFIMGDRTDNGPEDIKSTAFWKNCRDSNVSFAEQYKKDGGFAEVFDLPKMGIKGNSHFLFQELNNKEIADLVEDWIKKNVSK